MPYPARPAVERFWAKVDKAGPAPEHCPHLGPCWVWTACTSRGYGRFQVECGGLLALAHRFSYELNVGPIPDGLDVLHACDNRACIRPDHLFVGTQGDNGADMTRKGRSSRGSKRPGAKLTEADVLALRRARRDGATYAELMSRFGMSKASVGRIVRGEQWTHASA